jgi:hypothetical protein
MGFEYGSQAIEVRNPFRAEGAAYALRGLIVAAAGVYLLLFAGVGDGVAEPDARVVLQLAAGVLLLAGGLYALGLGLFKMFRFYVGRGVPANLAATVAASATIAPGSEDSFRHPGIYNPAKLSEMLSGRKNLTFEEPRGWLARLLNGMCFLHDLPAPSHALDHAQAVHGSVVRHGGAGDPGPDAPVGPCAGHGGDHWNRGDRLHRWRGGAVHPADLDPLSAVATVAQHGSAQSAHFVEPHAVPAAQLRPVSRARCAPGPAVGGIARGHCDDAPGGAARDRVAGTSRIALAMARRPGRCRGAGLRLRFPDGQLGGRRAERCPPMCPSTGITGRRPCIPRTSSGPSR